MTDRIDVLVAVFPQDEAERTQVFFVAASFQIPGDSQLHRDGCCQGRREFLERDLTQEASRACPADAIARSERLRLPGTGLEENNDRVCLACG